MHDAPGQPPASRGLAELGLLAAFQYAAAHYVVTLVVLVWLHQRAPAHYVAARRALVLATLVALVLYLVVPTAPPRLLDGWTDLMVVHSGPGWWGEAASAPQGFGWLTNQLAALPSMHAGWALWVALAVQRASGNRVAVGLGWTHAVVTAVVVVGTANHWVLDVAAGWAVVGVAWWASWRLAARGTAREHRVGLDPVAARPARPAERERAPAPAGSLSHP